MFKCVASLQVGIADVLHVAAETSPRILFVSVYPKVSASLSSPECQIAKAFQFWEVAWARQIASNSGDITRFFAGAKKTKEASSKSKIS